MSLEDLGTANELILQAISESDGETILGFLSLSQDEENFVLEAVRYALSLRPFTIESLLESEPAASAYALAVAPSRTLKTGGRFWPALKEDLGLEIDSNRRCLVSSLFCDCCRRLDLLDGTLHDAKWKYAAPFMFQAGIIHYWKDALARGLRSTLNSLLPPDLQDEVALNRFVAELNNHIRANQANLSHALESSIGPLLVRRLLKAYVSDEWTVLPVHLQDPIKEAFRDYGRNLTIRSPYLMYDSAFWEINLVLPSQSDRIASTDTYWKVGNRRHPARMSTSIPIEELSADLLDINLCKMLQGFENKKFCLESGLSEQIPFRIFNQETGRECRCDLKNDIALSPGTYQFVMMLGVETSDEEYIDEHNGLRMLELEFRPGDDPFVLESGSKKWIVKVALRRGFYTDWSIAESILMEDGERLHYGQELGLIAYLPAHDHAALFKLDVCCDAQNVGHSRTFERDAHTQDDDVYTFQSGLSDAIKPALDALSPGIHLIKISLSHATSLVNHTLWYWKGLQSINEIDGFRWSAAPKNLKQNLCKGLKFVEGGCRFNKDYHAPTVLLALSQPETELRLVHAGVQVVVTEPGADWEDENTAGQDLIVRPNDKRILRFRSGGTQQWDIIVRDRVIATLDRKRTLYTVSLAGLASECGGTGCVYARNNLGHNITLISFSRPLTAVHLKHDIDHGQGIISWTFEMPIESLHALGAVISDVTNSPELIKTSDQVVTIAERIDQDTEEDHGNKHFKYAELQDEEMSLVVSIEDDNAEYVHDVATALSLAEAHLSQTIITVSAHINDNALEDRLLAVDFYIRTSPDSEWNRLEYADKQGYSQMRILAWGRESPPADAGWWRKLKSSHLKGVQAEDSFENAIRQIVPEDLDKALEVIRSLLVWKYPSKVWHEAARDLTNMPICLGRYRYGETDDSAVIWWRHGVAELVDYAAVTANPVVSRFLFAAQPKILLLNRRYLKVEEGVAFCTPVGRCLNLPAAIHDAGSLKTFVLAARERNEIDECILYSFGNLVQAQMDPSCDLKDLSFSTFLNGGPGVSGLKERTECLNEACPRVSVDALLGPEHLLYAVKALNRRCRLIHDVSSLGDDSHPLSKVAQSLEEMSQRIDRVEPSVAKQFRGCGKYIFWTPPLLENRWSDKVARLIWLVVVLARMAANGVVSRERSEKMMLELLGVDSVSSVRYTTRLCVLMSLGVELFTFYFALFELMFPVNESSGG